MVSISYWRVCGLQLLLFHVIFTQMYTLDVILLFYTMLASQESVFLYQYELCRNKDEIRITVFPSPSGRSVVLSPSLWRRLTGSIRSAAPD